MTYIAESKYDNSYGVLTEDSVDLLMEKIEEIGDVLESWDCYEDGKLAEFQCSSLVSGHHFHEQCENTVPWPGLECERHV